MKAWRFHGVTNGAENNMHIENIPFPSHFHNLPPNSTLIKVHSVALNPVDIKFAETPLVGRFMHALPAIPGLDGVGRVVKTTDPTLNIGQAVTFRKQELQAEGALTEYVVVSREGCAIVPEGVSLLQAATVGTCGVTAYQAIAPFVLEAKKETEQPGLKIFINGGSGGAGVFQIQVAKLLGAQVVTSCSTPNVALCKSLGADEVIDYRQGSVGDALKEMVQREGGSLFDLVVDNVDLPWNLYKAADVYLKESGVYVQIGGEFSLQAVKELMYIKLRPVYVGGGQRTWNFMAMKTSREDAEKVLAWMAEGKVTVPIHSVEEFENVPEAYRMLKTGRARGKIVIRVCEP
ncbi:NAD(P)-binding protein [Sarocladium strictum]